MSPEQLCGQPVDPRADQFSFCVSLYEALYGERPFAGDNFAQLRAAVLEGRPRPVAPVEPRPRARARDPAARSVRRRRAALPGHGGAAQGARPGHRRSAPACRAWSGVGVAAGAVAFAVAFGVAWQLRGPRPPSKCASPPANLDRGLADERPTPRAAPRFAAPFWPPTSPTRASATSARASRSTPTRTPGRRCTARPARPSAAGGDAQEAVALRMGCLDQRAASSARWRTCSPTPTRRSCAARSPPRSRCRRSTAARTRGRSRRIAAPPDEALRARVQALRGRLATLWAMAAAGHDWQALEADGHAGRRDPRRRPRTAAGRGAARLRAHPIAVRPGRRRTDLRGGVQARRGDSQRRAGRRGGDPAGRHRGRDRAPIRPRRALGAHRRGDRRARRPAARAWLVPAQPRHAVRGPGIMAAARRATSPPRWRSGSRRSARRTPISRRR